MEFYGYSTDEYNKEAVFDFNTEKPYAKVIGLFAVIKQPRICFVLNSAFLICVGVIFAFLISMAIYTIYLPTTKMDTKILNLEFLCMMSCCVVLPWTKLSSFREMDEAVKALKRGNFSYSDGWEDVKLSNIMRKRVKFIRFLANALTIACYVSSIPTAFQYPLTQLLIQDKNADFGINPYLPIPIYLPYATDGIFTFCTAFFCETLFYFVFYCVMVSVLDTTIGSAMQLVAQIEILNHSLKNIEKRAYSKYKNNKHLSADFVPLDVYSNGEFQQCLYSCLKENILHHRAILRYTSHIRDFLQGVNTFCIAIYSALFALSLVPILEDPVQHGQLMMIVLGETIGYFQISWTCQRVIDKIKMSILQWNINGIQNHFADLEYLLYLRPMDIIALQETHTTNSIVNIECYTLYRRDYTLGGRACGGSSEIFTSVYDTPWYYADKKFRVLISILLSNVREPIVFYSYGIKIVTGSENFADMLSLAYKLINIILNQI